jgi:hypothetical protein
MKIHIVKENQTPIENYKRVNVSNNKIDLSEISDNECSFILANDVLNNFSLENIAPFVQGLIKKIRLKGSVVIGGTELRMFCKSVTNGLIGAAEASGVIDSVQSMTTVEETVNLLKTLGLNIESTQMSGVHYEIKATRG